VQNFVWDLSNLKLAFIQPTSSHTNRLTAAVYCLGVKVITSKIRLGAGALRHTSAETTQIL